MTERAIKYILLFFLTAILLQVRVASSQTTQSLLQTQGTGTITGRIMIKGGGALSGGQVTFYRAEAGAPPDSEKYEKIPDYVRLLDESGRFSVELPAGIYYLRAVKRLSGERLGPPREGDYIFRSVDENKRFKEYRVEAGKALDIGTIGEAVPMSKKQTNKHVISTAIEGVIVNTEGSPVAHIVVAAFLEPVARSKPVFVSDRTGEDGKYRLRLPPGTYYLRARQASFGGPPVKGHTVGYYGTTAPAPVTVKEGEVLKGIDFGVLVFPGRGPLTEENQGKQEPRDGGRAGKNGRRGATGVYK